MAFLSPRWQTVCDYVKLIKRWFHGDFRNCSKKRQNCSSSGVCLSYHGQNSLIKHQLTCVYLSCLIRASVIFHSVHDFLVIVANQAMNMFLFWLRNRKYDLIVLIRVSRTQHAETMPWCFWWWRNRKCNLRNFTTFKENLVSSSYNGFNCSAICFFLVDWIEPKLGNFRTCVFVD